MIDFDFRYAVRQAFLDDSDIHQREYRERFIETDRMHRASKDMERIMELNRIPKRKPSFFSQFRP